MVTTAKAIPQSAARKYNVPRWTNQGVTLREDGILRLFTKRGEDSILIDWPVGTEPRTVGIGRPEDS
jgi:putative transposase